MVLNCRVQNQIKHRFDIGVCYLIVAQSNLDFVSQRLSMAEIHKLRTLRESDVLILELAGRSLSEINRQGICYIQSAYLTSYTGGHASTAVCNNDGVTAAVYCVR